MTRTMKAIVKARPAPGLELREVPVPEIGPGDVLIKTRALSICGSDLHIDDAANLAPTALAKVFQLATYAVDELIELSRNPG